MIQYRKISSVLMKWVFACSIHSLSGNPVHRSSRKPTLKYAHMKWYALKWFRKVSVCWTNLQNANLRKSNEYYSYQRKCQDNARKCLLEMIGKIHPKVKMLAIREWYFTLNLEVMRRPCSAKQKTLKKVTKTPSAGIIPYETPSQDYNYSDYLLEIIWQGISHALHKRFFHSPHPLGCNLWLNQILQDCQPVHLATELQKLWAKHVRLNKSHSK